MPEVKAKPTTKLTLRYVEATGVVRGRKGIDYQILVQRSGEPMRLFKGKTREEFDRDLEAATAAQEGR